MTDREKELTACLLWLRNHYDCGDRDKGIRQLVLERADRVLGAGDDVTAEMQAAFRKKYPVKGMDEAKPTV